MKHIHYLISATFLSTVLFFTSCGESPEMQQGPIGPMPYAVLTLNQQKITVYTEYPASIQGEQDIEIRPKIDGYIESVNVIEGQAVKKGQVLFRISNPLYEQNMRNAAAAVDVAESEVANARLNVAKTKPLIEKGIVSSYELESAQISLKSKEAALRQARANYANAKTNVGYTSITSPFNGVVGTLPYKLGSFVSSNMANPLTVVSSISKVYAYFSLNEKEEMAFFKNTTGATLEDKIKHFSPVTMVLADNSIYELKGKIETFSGQVSSSTGSFNVRAGFPNPNGLLRTGNSAKIRIFSSRKQVIIVPQNSTFEVQGKRFIYVVNPNKKVTGVEITISEIPGGQFYVVEKGLKPGQQVVVDGVATLTDNTAIIPKKTNADSIYSSLQIN